MWQALATVGASMINGFMGSHRDSVQFRRQRILNKENNEFNAREAEKQRQAQANAQAQQERYNSEQAQVSRLKQAGLNPALLYGGATSSGGIGSMDSAAASPSSYTPTGQQADMLGAISAAADMDLKRAQIDNLNTNTQSQGEDVVSKSVQNKYVDSKSNVELLQMLQNLENLKKQGALSDKDLEWYDKIKTSALDQIKSQIDNWTSQNELNKANADYVSGAKTNETQANADYVSGAKTDESKSQAQLNLEKAKTESTIRKLNLSSELRNYAEKALAQSQIKNNTAVRNEILRKYGLDKSESDLIEEALDKVGLSKGWTNTVLDAFGEFRRETGKGLGEFFSGDNWINFLGRKYQVDKDFEIGKQRNENDRYRTDEWKHTNDNGIKQQTPTPDDVETDKKLSDGAPNDAVRTVPSVENLNKEWKRKMQYLDVRTKIQLSDIVKDRYPNWSKEQKDKFKKEFYYARTKQEIVDIINRYSNLK